MKINLFAVLSAMLFVTSCKKDDAVTPAPSTVVSFTKTTGEIKMVKKTKQKFYQIPFGRLLNLIEEKLTAKEIKVIEINEAYTSKTSSLNADIVKIQEKSKKKEKILPNDLNGSRGNRMKGNLNNPMGRGLFKDIVDK